jgi:cyanophycinase
LSDKLALTSSTMVPMGTLLLEGGAEFGGRMSEPDLRAVELAGGPAARVAILPTAAAPDHNDERAGRNGQRWFSSLGASNLDVVPVVDKASAGDAALAARLRSARLIYMLGGFPGFLAQTLSGSRAWQACLDAYAHGAVLAGSSAGAMVLCQHVYDPDGRQTMPGLNLIPNACVLPHHNTFGRGWARRLQQALPGALLIGIDEQTGMLGDPAGAWTVWGAGQVILYRGSDIQPYASGALFTLETNP